MIPPKLPTRRWWQYAAEAPVTLKTLIFNADGTIKPDADSASAIQFKNAAADSTILSIDTTNKRIGIGLTAPIVPLHVFREDRGLVLANLSNDKYVFVGESEDAVIGLASEDQGGHGSAIDLMEVEAGVLQDKWAIVRGSSTAGLSALKFRYGTNADYSTNPTLLEISTAGLVTIDGSAAELKITPDSLGSNEVLFIGVPGDYYPWVFVTHVSAVDSQRLEFNSKWASGPGYADWVFRHGDFGIHDGDLEVYDSGDLGGESLAENDFATHDEWDVVGDFDDAGGDATYTHSAGSGTLTQVSGSLLIAGVGYRWYKFAYTVSAVTHTGTMAATITTGFAAAAQSLDLSEGAHFIVFQAKSSPGDFVISGTSDTASDTFTLDDVSLKEVQGGDAIVNGIITGGGTAGIKVLANGSVGFGTTAPAAPMNAMRTTSGITGMLSLKPPASGNDLYQELVFEHWSSSANPHNLAAIRNTMRSGWGGELSFWVMQDADDTLYQRLTITEKGNIGIGTQTFGTNAAGSFAIINAPVVPTSSIDNQIEIFSVDVSAKATIGLRTEAAVAADADESKFSNKLPIKINGTDYFIMLTTS